MIYSVPKYAQLWGGGDFSSVPVLEGLMALCTRAQPKCQDPKFELSGVLHQLCQFCYIYTASLRKIMPCAQTHALILCKKMVL